MSEKAESLKNISDRLPQKLSLEISISILQELADILSILKTINHWPNTENESFDYKTLQERYEKTCFQIETGENSLRPENFSFIALLCVDLLEELKQEGGYSKFAKIIDTLKKMKFDEETLLHEAATKENDVKQIQATIDSEKAVSVNKIMNCMADIGKIKDEIENVQIESDIKLNYIKSMQKTKLEMSDILFFKMITKTTEKIKTTKAKIAQDVRVHMEIETAMDGIIKELEERVEEWKNKYHEKLNEMNKKLDVLQEKQNKQLQIISDFKELFAKRQQEIDDYKLHKIEQEKLRLEKEKKNKAATKIQAWWRGTMVRKGFGKFRKKKEKKGKKKSSEKKEKNK